MKRESASSLFWAVFLSFFAAVAGIGCLITAFPLPVVNWAKIVLFCGGFALVVGIFYLYRWGSLVLTVLLLVALNIFLRHTNLLISLETLAYNISRLYHNGYGWGCIRWSQNSLEGISADNGLIFLGCLVICAVCWTLLRKKWVGFGLLGGLFPLMLCCLLLDTVPHWIPLWVLICCLFLLMLSHRARKFDSLHANMLTLRLILPVLLFCSLIFAAAPTVSYEEPAKFLLDKALEVIHSLQDPAPGPSIVPGPGTSDTVNAESLELSQVGPLELGQQRVMLLTTSYQGKLYLRSRAYDTYTGVQWESNAKTTGEGGWPTNGMNTVFDLHIYTLKPEDTMYLPYYIAQDDWSEQLQYGLMPNPEKRQSYHFPLRVVSKNAAFAPLSAEDQETYLALPAETRLVAEEICASILSAEDSVAEKVLKIGEFIRNSAEYDLNTSAMPAGETDFALWFLEKGETGYCVHFATAATVLLRASGIPARYVAGYLADSAGVGNTSVTEDQAHAWVEYLDPNRGWTVLEATPGVLNDQEETLPPTETQPPTDTLPPTETQPTQTQPEETEKPTLPPATEPTDPQETRPSGGSGEAPKPIDLAWLWRALQGLLVVGILQLQAFLRKALRNWQLKRGPANVQAVKRWRYIRRFAWLTKQETPTTLYDLTEKAVYSQHSLTEKELFQYDKWIYQFHRHLLRAPWPLKLIYKLLLAI